MECHSLIKCKKKNVIIDYKLLWLIRGINHFGACCRKINQLWVGNCNSTSCQTASHRCLFSYNSTPSCFYPLLSTYFPYHIHCNFDKLRILECYCISYYIRQTSNIFFCWFLLRPQLQFIFQPLAKRRFSVQYTLQKWLLHGDCHSNSLTFELVTWYLLSVNLFC